MNESSPLRLRAGGSFVLPAESTEEDIDNAGRVDGATDQPVQPEQKADQSKPEEQP